MRRTWVTGAGMMLLAVSVRADDGVDYSQAFLWQSSVPRAAAPRAIVPMGDRVIVVGFDPVNGAELVVVDVDLVEAPVERGVVALDGVPGQAVAVGDIVLIASGASGLVAVDVSDPDKPFVAAGLTLPGMAGSIALGPEGTALVGLGTAWGRVDISEPWAPKLVATVAAEDWAGGVAAVGTRAFGAGGRAGLVEFDLAGDGLAVITRTPTDGYAVDVDASQELVVVADGERGASSHRTHFRGADQGRASTGG